MITITEKALGEIKRILDKEWLRQPLRIQVVGGGCSGMSYKLSFDGDHSDQDKFFWHDGVEVVIDAKSALFLNGMILDFSDGLNGTGFAFNNPNAKRTCGCGSSFST